MRVKKNGKALKQFDLGSAAHQLGASATRIRLGQGCWVLYHCHSNGDRSIFDQLGAYTTALHYSQMLHRC